MKSDRWIEKFFKEAMLQASYSKDESTKCGAVIVRPNNSICSTGFNGLPRGVNDNIYDRNLRPQKYFFFEHAERNAIYNSSDPSLEGYSIFVYTAPKKLHVCSDCARGIIQTGITEIYISPSETDETWNDSCFAAMEMFDEAGVKVYEIDIYSNESIKRFYDFLFDTTLQI